MTADLKFENHALEKDLEPIAEKLDCSSILIGEEEGLYRLGKQGVLLMKGRKVEKGDYCLDRQAALVCEEEGNR